MFYQNKAFNQDISNWNISLVGDFTNFMANTARAMSTINMDLIFNGWSSRARKTPITINFTSAYTSAGASGRAALVDTPWTIVDGGMI
ncbi:hypothetical protein D3C85_1568050 [compost metagenome]